MARTKYFCKRRRQPWVPINFQRLRLSVAEDELNEGTALVWLQTNVFDNINTPKDGLLCVTSQKIAGVGQNRFYLKFMAGRGRKLLPLVNYVHQFMIEKFELFCSLGMKMTRQILLDLDNAAVSRETSPVTMLSLYNHSGRPIADMFSFYFINRFFARYCTVRRNKSGSLSRAAEHVALR